MTHRKILTLGLLILLSVHTSSILFHRKKETNGRKLDDGEYENDLVDVRGIMDQNEKDNPLSQLFEADHMKIAKQNVNLNMNMPLNRLKLHLDSSYQVKIVVNNDEDFDSLYDYFYPKKKTEQEALDGEGGSVDKQAGESGARRLSKIKKFVKK